MITTSVTPITPVIAAPITAAASGPARDVVRPMLPDDVRRFVPDVALNARIGRGTVASEYDRAIRVRLEGAGAPSTRTIVPETTTAQRLLASPAGQGFEALIHRTAAEADAAHGADDLRSYTFVPDEHAAKAVTFLDAVQDSARATGERVTFGNSHKGWTEKIGAQKTVDAITKNLPAEINFAAAWNDAGHIMIMPDEARTVLSTINAYRFKAGDKLLTGTGAEAKREERLRDSIDTMVHETHHSVSPFHAASESENTAIIEEGVSSVFGKRDRSQVMRGIGANDTVHAVAADPTGGSKDLSGIDWAGWNRDHLPQPPAGEVATSHGRYVDGPKVLRDILHLAGVDLRTKAGEADTYQLLQGKPSQDVPRVLADALIARRGVDPSHREQLVDRIRRSVASPSGAKLVSNFLTQIGAAAPA
jgi:hypothetical protein